MMKMKTKIKRMNKLQEKFRGIRHTEISAGVIIAMREKLKPGKRIVFYHLL